MEVKIAGRIMSRRIMGKASFIELKDFTGRHLNHELQKRFKGPSFENLEL